MRMTDACGICRERWSKCTCPPRTRTESIESLLNDDEQFPNHYTRHLCIFVYHNYLRFRKNADADDFNASCIPPWEGWYAAWLRPVNGDAEIVPWSEQSVVKCYIQYADGTSLTGYIDYMGQLTVDIPASCPPNCLSYDLDRRVISTRLQVTQILSLEEICSGIRGTVHGPSGRPNSGRRVSHVVKEEKGNCILAKLPSVIGAEIDTVVIATSKLQSYAPHLYEERKWRLRRRFSKKNATILQKYLCRMFERARRNDEAVRLILERGWKLSNSDDSLLKISGELAKQLDIHQKKEIASIDKEKEGNTITTRSM